MLIQRIKKLRLWEKKSFRLGGYVFLLLILGCIIGLIMPCQVYEYEGSCCFDENTAPGLTDIYEGISLSPGVYRVELEYATDVDLANLCNLADGTVMNGWMKTNGEHLYSGLGKTGFDVWLYEKTDSMRVQVDYTGGHLTTGSLKIVETNKLWTMLLTVVLAVWAVFSISLAFYYYDKEYPVSQEKKNVFFFVGVISLIASIPYLCGYNITGADLTYHLQRIEGVKDGLLGGQFPVRLEPRWLYDHGYANAIFYCNTFLYFPALLRILGFTVTASYNIYCIAMNIATAWISCYCFGRIFENWRIGIICSALYTLSIFRIYKFVVTSAVGEGSAVTFMPLVIYGMYRIFAEDSEERRYKSSWIPLAFGLAGLIQTHVLSCEITAFVIFLFCLAGIKKVFQKNTFLELVKGAVGALLFSLWFLVPFLDYYFTQDVHIKHVSARTIQDRGLYFAHLGFHFWKTGTNTPMAGNGMESSHPVGLGLVLLLGLGIFLIFWFSGYFRKETDRRVSFAKKAAVAGAFLLFMSTGSFPWDRIQKIHPVAAALVSSLQFPNRFLGWGTVCLVFVFGYCLWYFRNKNNRLCLGMAVLALIGVTTSSMHLFDYVNGGQEYFELYNEESMGFGYISGAEYLIEGTDDGKLTYAGVTAGDGVEVYSCEKGYLQAEIQCANKKGEDSYVDIPLLLYKGYRAVNTDTGEPLALGAGENNVVRVGIPSGFDGSLRVFFESPVCWRVSEWISAGTVVLFLTVWAGRKRREYADREV